MNWEDDIIEVFNLDTDRQGEDEVVDTVRAFIFKRLAKDIILSKISTSPSPLLYRVIDLLNEDLQLTRKYMSAHNIRVHDKYQLTAGGFVDWEFFAGGRTNRTGGSRSVIKKEVKRYIDYYISLAKERDDG